MSKTLLAVDDSATIRKALEITFAGEGYRVLAADSRAAALAKLADNPDLVLIDTVLGADDGYALCSEVRAQAPGVAIVLLSSRFNPYDSSRGQAAGADEYCDKPFDTQQLLDKARTVLEAKANSPAAAAPPAAPPHRAPVGPTPTPANAIPAAQTTERPSTQPSARAQTLVFGTSPVASPQTVNPYTVGIAKPAEPAPATPAAPPPVPARVEPPRPAPVAEAPRPTPAVEAPRPTPAAASTPAHAAPPAAPAAAAPPVAATVSAQMSPALSALGLSQEQVDAVLALSREVVERVVWEVVPQLAEVMIREEITRLTKE